MKLDDLDTDILLAILQSQEGCSTTTLAHQILNPASRYELKKADSKLRYRVKRLEKAGLLSKNGLRYSINEERVSLTPATLKLAIGAEVPMGIMLIVIPKDGEVRMRQIFFEENSQKSQD